jgi:hypothetical protein
MTGDSALNPKWASEAGAAHHRAHSDLPLRFDSARQLEAHHTLLPVIQLEHEISAAPDPGALT